MSLLEADLVRRSAAKFSGQRERERLRGKFLKAAEQMGLQGPAREETWMMVEKFAGFGFLQSARCNLRGHLLSHDLSQNSSHRGISGRNVQRGRRLLSRVGICGRSQALGDRVRLPSVNRSRMEYTTERNRRALRTMAARKANWEAAIGSADTGERIARGNDSAQLLRSRSGRAVPFAGGFPGGAFQRSGMKSKH